MTRENNLALNLSPAPESSLEILPPFVKLENVPRPPSSRYVSLAEIYRMWLRAQDDYPAGGYKPRGCPIRFEGDIVHMWFDFFALPSSRDLDYTLHATIGEIERPEVVALVREKDILVGLTDHYDLDFLPESLALAWETGCWSRRCEPLPHPPFTLDGYRLRFGRELFGVARMAATAFARRYRLSISINKGDNSITGLAPVITAAWRDLDGAMQTEQLDIDVPDCVTHALEMCDGNLGNIYCRDREDPPVNVYYSMCDGSLLDTRPGPDPESFCWEGDVWSS